jgi:ABC-type Fe3+-hydroxamate transport system substrate-binding protein
MQIRYSTYCVVAGTINIAANAVGPSGTIDTEWIMKENPDAILGLAYKGGYNTDNISDLKNQYDEIMSLPLLQNVSAVRNNRVYVIGFRFTNGPTYPAAYAAIAKWMYLICFAILKILRRFIRNMSPGILVDYNVSEHGVYYYPK